MDDSLDCDNAEEVGLKLQQAMDDESFAGASLKRSSKVKTLADLQPGVHLDGNTYR